MVDRLILLAAGKGERLRPLTVNTPKPLVRVNGVRMIDTVLAAAEKNGIPAVYIVVGHLGEQFEVLKKQYYNIRLIENKDYQTANNISSIYAARHLLSNAFVCEADLLIQNSSLLDPNQTQSNYLGVPTAHTDDWCFESKDGIISKISVGGDRCHHMFGLSYWTKEDGERLAGHVEELYKKDWGKQLYWDEVALKYYIGDYRIRIRECTFEDILEIDTLKELQTLDKSYLF